METPWRIIISAIGPKDLTHTGDAANHNTVSNTNGLSQKSKSFKLKLVMSALNTASHWFLTVAQSDQTLRHHVVLDWVFFGMPLLMVAFTSLVPLVQWIQDDRLVGCNRCRSWSVDCNCNHLWENWFKPVTHILELVAAATMQLSPRYDLSHNGLKSFVNSMKVFPICTLSWWSSGFTGLVFEGSVPNPDRWGSSFSKNKTHSRHYCRIYLAWSG